MIHKYYVYVRPGQIRLFDDLAEALEYAQEYGAEVKEC